VAVVKTGGRATIMLVGDVGHCYEWSDKET
jgi:hypothetical protein